MNKDAKKEINKIIDETLRQARRSGTSTNRHPAEVTSDRLGDAATKFGGLLTGEELDMIGVIRHAFQEIAEGKRAEGGLYR